MNVDDVKALATRIREEVAKAITGQHDTVDLMLTALFAGGHILLEGPPGTAKTMTARCFAQALGVAYGRIQFTPDLMPGDIVGSNIYNFQTGQFTLTRGPIFCELLLADEINRTPPKTQAALLEAMQEHAVTFDGTTHSLGRNFMVVATQNPIIRVSIPCPKHSSTASCSSTGSAIPVLRRNGPSSSITAAAPPRTTSRNTASRPRRIARRWRRHSKPSAPSPSSTMSSATSRRWCAPHATPPIWRLAPVHARGPCWPGRRGRGQRSTGAPM